MEKIVIVIADPQHFAEAFEETQAELILSREADHSVLVSFYTAFLQRMKAILPENLLFSKAIEAGRDWHYLHLSMSLEEAREYFANGERYDLIEYNPE